MDYLYDGSFDGLLTCIYHSYYSDRATGIYLEDDYQYSLLNSCLSVQTAPELAFKVYSAISSKISREALTHTYYVFLSNRPDKGNLIHSYLRLGFKLGPSVSAYRTHPDVLPVLETAHKVSFEAHRFEGLLRFADMGKFLYSSLAPDHNIIILLADFFADRLKQEHFMIHDKKRELAVIYDTKEWYVSDFSSEISLGLSADEAFYQELWLKYFDRIGIAHRINPRLQARFVPHRYRKDLPEFNNILNGHHRQ